MCELDGAWGGYGHLKSSRVEAFTWSSMWWFPFQSMVSISLRLTRDSHQQRGVHTTRDFTAFGRSLMRHIKRTGPFGMPHSSGAV